MQTITARNVAMTPPQCPSTEAPGPHYGTDPNNLSQTAKSPIRVNRAHPYTGFRVRMPGLTPKTTYYYTVASAEPNGKSDGVKSPVKHFTTP